MKRTLVYQSMVFNIQSFICNNNTCFFLYSSYGAPSSSSSSEAGRGYPTVYQRKQSSVNDRRVCEERAKWGDRGVTVGHMYDPLIQTDSKVADGPVWLERGINDSRDSGDESVL